MTAEAEAEAPVAAAAGGEPRGGDGGDAPSDGARGDGDAAEVPAPGRLAETCVAPPGIDSETTS